MRKLVLLLAFVATQVNADLYYMGFHPKALAGLVMDKDLEPPRDIGFAQGLTWGTVSDTDPNVAEYVKTSKEVIVIDQETYNERKQKCGGVLLPECLQEIFQEVGHDQTSVD